MYIYLFQEHVLAHYMHISLHMWLLQYTALSKSGCVFPGCIS